MPEIPWHVYATNIASLDAHASTIDVVTSPLLCFFPVCAGCCSLLVPSAPVSCKVLLIAHAMQVLPNRFVQCFQLGQLRSRVHL